MRILVTSYSIASGTGGLRIGVLGMCKGLAKRGHQVVLYTTNADENKTVDVPLGVPVFEEDVEVYFHSAQMVVCSNAISFPIVKALKNRVLQSDLVLIHSLYQLTSTIAAHYCRQFKVPYVLRPHGTLDPFLVYRRRWALKWAYINLFERRNFNLAAAIQYSSRMEEEMTRHFITVKSPSLIIPEGINLEDFAGLPPRGTFRARFPELAGKTLILYLGRFHQKKGLELLVEAFSGVASRCANAHLVLAGNGDRHYVERIIQMLRDLGIAGRSTITGQLSDDEKLAALADADLFVLPSHGENFGISVVEAMACGLPVLISDKVGIWREIAEAETGIVTECHSGKIADAMEKLVNDAGLRVKLGNRGKRLVETQFSTDQMAERMEVAYSRLVIGHKAAFGTA